MGRALQSNPFLCCLGKVQKAPQGTQMESFQWSRKEHHFSLGISGLKALEIVQTKYFTRAHGLAITKSSLPVILKL